MENVINIISFAIVAICVYLYNKHISPEGRKNKKRERLRQLSKDNWEINRLKIQELAKPFGHHFDMHTSNAFSDRIMEQNYADLKNVVAIQPTQGFSTTQELENHWKQYQKYRVLERKYYDDWCYYAGTNKNYKGPRNEHLNI